VCETRPGLVGLFAELLGALLDPCRFVPNDNKSSLDSCAFPRTRGMNGRACSSVRVALLKASIALSQKTVGGFGMAQSRRCVV
jgi:hypothetical protein